MRFFRILFILLGLGVCPALAQPPAPLSQTLEIDPDGRIDTRVDMSVMDFKDQNSAQRPSTREPLPLSGIKAVPIDQPEPDHPPSRILVPQLLNQPPVAKAAGVPDVYEAPRGQPAPSFDQQTSSILVTPGPATDNAKAGTRHSGLTKDDMLAAPTVAGGRRSRDVGSSRRSVDPEGAPARLNQNDSAPLPQNLTPPTDTQYQTPLQPVSGYNRSVSPMASQPDGRDDTMQIPNQPFLVQIASPKPKYLAGLRTLYDPVPPPADNSLKAPIMSLQASPDRVHELEAQLKKIHQSVITARGTSAKVPVATKLDKEPKNILKSSAKNKPQAPVGKAGKKPSANEMSSFETKLFFEGENGTLTGPMKDVLTSLVSKVKPLLRGDDFVLSITGYASGTEEESGKARRLSLERAANVREFIVSQDIDDKKVVVKALGNKTSDKQKDRVDIGIDAAP